MKKYILKKTTVLLLPLLMLFIFCFIISAELECNRVMANSCPTNEVRVMGQYSGSNSHAAVHGDQTSLSLCCKGLDGLTATSGTTFLWLSNDKNSHVTRINNPNYQSKAMIGASKNVVCENADKACSTDYGCITTISSQTNAHVADCDSPYAYDLKVCCKEGCPEGKKWDDLEGNCIDADPCLLSEEWDCLSGDRCTCHASGDCYWYPDSTCNSGVGSSPDPACTNICTSGSTQCSGTAGYQTCSDYGSGCSSWGSTISCGAGYGCSGGTCSCTGSLYKRQCKTYSVPEWTKLCNMKYSQNFQTNIAKNYIQKCHTIAEKIGAIYAACQTDITDTQCCANSQSCVYGNQCYDDGKLKDVDDDGFVEICVAHSEGEWVEVGDEVCTGGLDEDADGLIDCADPDCSGTITGYVYDENSLPLEGAAVKVFDGLTVIAEDDYTEPDGYYELINVLCGTHDITASKTDYVPVTQTITLDPKGTLSVDFSSAYALAYGLVCEADCTYLLDDVCRSECETENPGCSFYDSVAKAKCDMSKKGWIVDYDSTQKIECCEEEPFTMAAAKAVPSCPNHKNLVQHERIMFDEKKGEPVRMITVVCGGD